jgi:uncharacterized protein with ParB-like and HNH nuclease domain
MDAKAKAVREILHSGDQFLVPFFQRSYSWQLKHWKRLWNDLRALLEDTGREHHFLGPLVCSSLRSQPGEIHSFQLIDGQQRLTTLSLLLTAVRDTAVRIGDQMIAAQVAETYLINRFEQGVKRYKVIPRVGDREVFFALADGKPVKSDDTTSVDEAHRYFSKAIQTDGFSDSAKLRHLFDTIVGRLYLVVITLDGENPYEIFESLNSTGLPLQESDLIRNFLFMQLPLEEHEGFQEERWKGFEERFEPAGEFKALPATKFYREFLMRNGRYSRAGATFVDYKSYFQEKQLDSVSAVREISRFVELSLGLTRKGQGLSPAVAKAIAKFELLDAATAHPLLLNLLDKHANGSLSSEDLLGIFSDLASFIVRRSFCGESTRAYGRWFCEAINSLGVQPREGLQSYLAHRGWPDDETFIKSVEEFPAYRRELKKVRLILESVEESYGHKEKVDLSTLQIEHVMPQKLPRGHKGTSWRELLGPDWHRAHKQLLHTLGNLTLTGYNPNLSNKPFADKREELIKSKLSLNAFFQDTSDWSAEVIRARSQEVARKVVKMWPRPDGIADYKPTVSPRAEVPRAGRERRRAYWTRFVAMLIEQNSPWLPVEPTDGTVLQLSLPTTNAALTVRFQLNKRRFQILLRFAHARGKQIFALLSNDRASIDAEFQHPATWGAIKEPTVSVHLDNSTIKDALDWHDQHTWIAERLGEFYSAFYNRLAELEKQVVEKNPTKQLQLEYWTVFRDLIESSNGPIRPKKPQPQHWQDFAIGRAGVVLTALMNTQAKRIGVQLALVGPNAKPYFYLLQRKRAELEMKFGGHFNWDEAPEKKQSRIGIYRDGYDPFDKSSWRDQHAWLLEQLHRFHDTFAPAVKNLNADDYRSDEL